jgi:hypothetical protein
MGGGLLTFNFANPTQFFGAYLTGVQTAFFADYIQFNDGTIETITIPGSGTTNTNGEVAFFGFTDAGKSINSITIDAGTGSSGDFIGVDDVSFQVVPEPSSLELCGIACLCGLAYHARRRSRDFAARRPQVHRPLVEGREGRELLSTVGSDIGTDVGADNINRHPVMTASRRSRAAIIRHDRCLTGGLMTAVVPDAGLPDWRRPSLLGTFRERRRVPPGKGCPTSEAPTEAHDRRSLESLFDEAAERESKGARKGIKEDIVRRGKAWDFSGRDSRPGT